MDEEGYINKAADRFISKCTPNEAAFERLEKMRKKAPDLDYEAELAAYREEKYGHYG